MKAGKLARYLPRESLASTAARDVSGAVAAQAFTRFDAGADPRDVVTELAIAADTVEYLWRTWARLRGRIIVSPANLCALAAALHSRRMPETADELAELVQRLVDEEQSACSRCGRDIAQYCYACPGRAAAEVRVEGPRRQRRKPR